jgi:LSD1 subclass zinc finger protein
MLASAQPILQHGAAPILGFAKFPCAGCRTGRQRATGSVSITCAISIADAKAGVVEAGHLQ